jgi:beta-glucosidase
MGTAMYFNKNLVDSVKEGLVPVSVIDDKVKRILRLKLFTQRTPVPAGTQEVSTPAHNKTAYDIAGESIVLLKNTRKNLPLKGIKNSNIVVIGNNALQKNAQGGFGAGVKARYEITPLEGLKNRMGKDARIEFVQGYKATFHRGNPFGMFPDTLPDQKLIAEAVKAAASADVALLFVGNNREVETENSDRKSLDLPFGQDALIKAVCAANPNTVVIVVAGAPVNLHVIDSCASTILWSWFNGSQAGYALADVILGKINPSGKLPFTIPVKLNDSPAHALGTFPGNEKAEYSEGILVGYRWFDTKDIAPAYCFGYGLSYTDFTYGEAQTNKPAYSRKDTAIITFNLTNTGEYDGHETVQLYVKEMNPKVTRPAKELKAFKKMFVTAGNETTVTLSMPIADLAWFDEKLMNWVVNPGTYQLAIGSSSRDIRKVTQIKVK